MEFDNIIKIRLFNIFKKMIIIILGGIGSGKTLSAVKEIVDNKQFALTNFKLKNVENYHRLKISDILVKDEKKYRVNWDFWEDIRKKHKNYSIFLDEIHNIIHSRRSMTSVNIQMSKWVSQIRKILADHPTNHLYLISQTARKIDVDFRDLAQIVILCRKYEFGSIVLIKQMWFEGMQNYEFGRKKLMTRFWGNKYYRYFKTGELVTFSDADKFL